jgi:small subunit ribosomal protein S19
MARSAKKGPFIDPKLLKKILKQKQMGDKSPIKTWSRPSFIAPEFVGHTIAIHNGRNFINVFIVEGMVGHRLGEFSPTRVFRSHGRVVAREISKT